MAFGYVQKRSSTGTAVSSIALAFSTNVTGNNAIILAVSLGNGAVVSSINDNHSDTFIQAVSITNGNQDLEIWYALNVAGGATTITVNISGTDYPVLEIYEFSGVTGLDKTATNPGGTAATWSTGTTPTTSQASELLFSAAGANPTITMTAGSSQLQFQQASSSLTSGGTGYNIVSSTGAYSESFGGGNSIITNWAAAIATFTGTAVVVPTYFDHGTISQPIFTAFDVNRVVWPVNVGTYFKTFQTVPFSIDSIAQPIFAQQTLIPQVRSDPTYSKPPKAVVVTSSTISQPVGNISQLMFGVVNAGNYSKAPPPPIGEASWLSSTISQPYFTPYDVNELVWPASEATYFLPPSIAPGLSSLLSLTINQPFFEPYDENQLVWPANETTYFKAPPAPTGAASWLDDSISQPLFLPLQTWIFSADWNFLPSSLIPRIKYSTVALRTTLETPRNLGKAIFFSGGGYVDVPYASSLHPTDVLTVAITGFAQNWNTLSNTMALAGYAYSNSGFVFDVNDTPGDGRLWFKLHRGGSYVLIGIQLSVLTSGRHRFVGTFDGRFTKFYLDGVLQQTDDFGSTTTIDQTQSNDLAIGDNMNSGSTPQGTPWNNGIDEFLLVHAAWTQTDVNNDYGNAGGNPLNRRTPANIPGLVVGMHFDDNTANDFSGNNNNGTVEGTATYALGWHVLNPPVALLTTLEIPAKKLNLALKTTLQSSVHSSTLALSTTLFVATQSTTLALLTNIVYRGNATVGLLTTLEVVNKVQYPRGMTMSGLEFYNVIPGQLNTDYFESAQTTYNYFDSKGFPLVRLPILWERIQPGLNSALDPLYKSYVDASIQEAANAGQSVILDIHNFGRRIVINTGGFSLLTSSSSDAMFQGNYTLSSGVMTFPRYNRIYAGAYNNPVSPATTYAFQTDVELTADNGDSFDGLWVEFFRVDDNNRYYLVVSHESNNLQLYQVVNGVQTQLGGNVSETINFNTWYTINIDVGQTTPHTVTVSWNGTQVFSQTLNPSLTFGSVAFWGNNTDAGIRNFTLNVNGDTTAGRPGSGNFRIGDAGLTTANFADLWTKLATAYRSNPAVYGYDVMNEPHDMPVPTTPSNYNTTSSVTIMNQTAINAIRAVDKHKWIFAENDSFAGAQDFVSMYGSSPTPYYTDPSHKTVYVVHYYMDNDHSGTYALPFSSSNLTAISGDVTPFFSWIQSNGLWGMLGEYAVPNLSEWQICITTLLGLANTYGIWAVHWAAGDHYLANININPVTFGPPIVDAYQMSSVGRTTFLGMNLDMGTIALRTRLEATSNNIILQQDAVWSAPSLGTLYGSPTASWNSAGYLELTAAVNGQNGGLDFTGTLPQNIIISFDFWTGPGGGADAVWFYMGASAATTSEDDAKGGYIFAYDEYSGDSAPLQIHFDTSQIANTTGAATFADSTWHKAKIIISGTQITMFLDNVQTLQFTDIARSFAGSHYGWGARTGGENDEHRVRNLVINTPNNTLALLTNLSRSVNSTLALSTTLEAVVPDYANLDQQSTLTGATLGFGTFTGARYVGFGFTPNATGYLQRIAFQRVVGTQDIKIYVDNANSDSTPVHTVGNELESFTVANANLTGQFQVFTLPTPLYVVAGQQYVIYIAPWSITNNQYTNDFQNMSFSSGSYAGGQTILNTNGTWSNQSLTPEYALWIQTGSNIALLTTFEKINVESTLALATFLIYQSQETLALLTTLSAPAVSTLALLTTLEEIGVKSTLALRTTLEKAKQSSTVALRTILESLKQNSTLALKTTLQVIPQFSTVALLTTLESSAQNSTLALQATFETAGTISTVALLTTLEVIPQASTVALLTTLEQPTQSTLALLTIFEEITKSTLALSTSFQSIVSVPIALLTILEKIQVKSTLALSTTLEVIPHCSTLALKTTLEASIKSSTLALKTTLETTKLFATIALLTILETTKLYSTVALSTTLEKYLQNFNIALKTTLESAKKFSTLALSTTLEKAKQNSTLALSTTLESSKQYSTIAIKTTLESAKQFSTIALSTTFETTKMFSTVALKTTLESANQYSTLALSTMLIATRSSTLAILTLFLESGVSTLALKTQLDPALRYSTVALFTDLNHLITSNPIALLTSLNRGGVKTLALSANLLHFIGWHNDDFGHLGWEGGSHNEIPTPEYGLAQDGHPLPPTGGFVDDGSVW